MIEKIKDKLGKIIDSVSNKKLGELDAITSVVILENNVVDVKITLEDTINQEELKREIAKIIKIDLNYPGLKIEITEKVKEEVSEEVSESKIKYIGISSGKGGVGKSTVTANLALAFRKLGKKVGIIDVDIYGASIPFIFNMELKPLDLNNEGKIIPAKFNGIEIISTESFMPKDKPVMWRGPIASQMTKMFFNDVAWQDDIEIILIDMPPGTGDIAIDVRELVPKSEMIIVTNPNVAAANIAVKAGLGTREIGHKVIGVIENMSFYYNACSKEKEELFGSGGGSLVSKKLGVDLLAQIPITKPNSNDNIYDDTTIQAKMYYMIAKNYLEK